MIREKNYENPTLRQKMLRPWKWGKKRREEK
jgi:hypothetical protein